MWQKFKKKSDKNSKTYIVTQLENSKCDHLQILKLWQKKNLNCDKAQLLGLWQNSKTQIMKKSNKEKCDKTKKNSNCDKLQNSNWDKTQKLKLW